MLIPFLYRSTKKRQRSAGRGGERGEEEREGRRRGGRSGKGRGEREMEKIQVCSIHKKKENELIVALTATNVYTAVVEYFLSNNSLWYYEVYETLYTG